MTRKGYFVLSKKYVAGAPVAKRQKKFTKQAVIRDLKKNKVVYLMAVPALVYFIVFNYIPMFGLLMAFQDYKPKLGVLGSPFIGFQNFTDFFDSIYFFRTIRNTLLLSFLDLVVSFPITIIFALLLNEIKNVKFKRTIQTVSYMPYFISMVVVAGIIVDFCSSRGAITSVVSLFTGSNQNLLSMPNYWRPIYVLSGLWQGLGFGAIIYVAALAGVDVEQYEAARIDGANRLQQCWHITLPGISSTIIIMLILRIGTLMAVGQEKTILLYNSQIYETADIISSYVYRKGLQEFNYGYSSAVGMFNSVINFLLLVVSNTISKKYSETSLF